LTAREREVLLLLADAPTNRMIAKKLGISERTVRAHLTSLGRKIGVDSRVGAAIVAYRWKAQLRADHAE
jgi:two-component system nitrate/nitrite response regulator NarL